MAKQATDNTPKLNPAIANEFELVDWVGGYTQLFGKFGKVNITTLTKRQAERLIKMGFPKLRKKASQAELPATNK